MNDVKNGGYAMEKKYYIFILITICWILGTIGLTFNVNVPQDSSKELELVKLIFLSIGAYGVITATYFTVQNSLESTKNIQAKIHFEKIQNSTKFIERWDGPSLTKARDFTREIKKSRPKISDEDFKKEISDNVDLKRSVITLFNFWEGMYLAIIHGNADGDLLESAFRDAYCSIYEHFKVWMEIIKNDNPEEEENLRKFYNLWCR